MTNIFVYGTLMKNQGATHLLGSKAKLISKAEIRGKLYNMGWFPGLKDSDDGLVHGELWDIEASQLPRLDNYEGYREGDTNSLYVRQLVQVEYEDPKTGMSWETDAWAYFINRPVDESQRIVSGDWRNRGVKHGQNDNEEGFRTGTG